MKIHHLKLATFCPFGGRLWLGGDGPILQRVDAGVIHALLVETDRDGLVLVDTGLGLEDARTPAQRLGAGFVRGTRPRFTKEDTAARQIERLGFSRSDVRNIVVTHLDLDHAGGIPDFPAAKIHVHRAEQEAALHPRSTSDKERYRPAHFAHGPLWELHEGGGERWFGFESLRVVTDDILLVPLPGHSRGHSAVAVRNDDPAAAEWLLHAGDAYFFHEEKDDAKRSPLLVRAFQRLAASDNAARVANAQRIRDLHREHGRTVRIFCAHSPHELRAFA